MRGRACAFSAVEETMRARWVVVVVMLLAACGPRAPDWNVKDEDGIAWRLIECRHKADCMHRASSMCRNGYVDKYEGQNARAMMVRCKGGDNATDLRDWQ